jgi:hypothetical protein
MTKVKVFVLILASCSGLFPIMTFGADQILLTCSSEHQCISAGEGVVTCQPRTRLLVFREGNGQISVDVVVGTNQGDPYLSELVGQVTQEVVNDDVMGPGTLHFYSNADGMVFDLFVSQGFDGFARGSAEGMFFSAQGLGRRFSTQCR